jgi:putative ABC transport system ATP-binding protein
MVFDLEHVALVRSQAGQSDFRLAVESLRVQAGEYVAITGPSGCGKSTALDILGMLLKPTSVGRFVFSSGPGASEDIAQYWREGALDRMSLLRLRYFGYVLQTGELLPYLTVLENVILASSILGSDRRACRRRGEELLEALDIAHLRDKLPSNISIGERQRSAIARALASEPKIVLADEPTASLDPARARIVMQLLLDMVRKNGTTLIVVTHDLKLVSDLGFRQAPMTFEKDEHGEVWSVLRG